MGNVIGRTFEWLDLVRGAQADVVGAFGRRPSESPYLVVAERPHWRLRDYSGAGPPVLITAAPIKRPYIWDLAPPVSAIARCLERGLHIYLLEWTAPAPDAGLCACADQALSEALAVIAQAGVGRPFLAGHSLGGVLAAIHAALDPPCAEGLVLLDAPLCFREGSSPFRDAVVGLRWLGGTPPTIVPGSLLSLVCAWIAPGTFVWSRLVDAALSAADPGALEIHRRVEEWALDEAPLAGRLVGEILEWLLAEDRFCRERLELGDRIVGPSRVQMPILAVLNRSDQLVPREAVQPFLDRVSSPDVRLIEYPGDTGVALQHVGLLVGRMAHAVVWPQIFAWIDARARAGGRQIAPTS